VRDSLDGTRLYLMANSETRDHHFVPQFLLRPWTINGVLKGYWWEMRANKLASKERGTKAFCSQLDLLTLRAHKLGRDAVERIFFGHIDTKGAVARDQLLASGPNSLTVEQRCDFARLLLSLDARRPVNVSKLREAVQKEFVESLDNDDEILAAFEHRAIATTPSSYTEEVLGICLEDRALSVIQRLVDNPKVAGRLVNAHWHVVRLGPGEGSLVLSDRPLIRLRAYDHPGAAWVLPLTPKAAFVAVNHEANLLRIKKATPLRFAKKTNVSSASQAERFVFSVDDHDERWIGKYLLRATEVSSPHPRSAVAK
jgi:Protein of unknown function (DUF4238)